MNVGVKMPFKSKAQQAYLAINEPEVAKEFAEHTSAKQYKRLPQHVAKDKNGLQALSKKHRSSK